MVVLRSTDSVQLTAVAVEFEILTVGTITKYLNIYHIVPK